MTAADILSSQIKILQAEMQQHVVKSSLLKLWKLHLVEVTHIKSL